MIHFLFHFSYTFSATKQKLTDSFERERESTDVGDSELVKKRKGIERREITGAGLPSPRGEIESVGFVVGDAIPALEYLLASSVVPRGFRVG